MTERYGIQREDGRWWGSGGRGWTAHVPLALGFEFVADAEMTGYAEVPDPPATWSVEPLPVPVSA